MTTEQVPAPAPKPTGLNPLKLKSLEPKEVPEVLDFLRENGVAILVGAGLAAAVFLGWSLYRNFRSSQEVAASQQLFNAQSPEQVQAVLSQYPKTSSAPLAQLIVAAQAFDQGQYELALNQFAEFQKQHPGHELAANAELGVIQSREAMGQLEQALAEYTAFAAAHPGHYLEPAAVFGRARTLEQLGRHDEALAVYGAFLDAYADDERWAGRAEAARSFVQKEMRARARGDAPATSVVAPAALAPAFSFPGMTPEAAPSAPAAP